MIKSAISSTNIKGIKLMSKRLFFLLFLGITSILFGDIESHLKPALDKSVHNKMKHIDFIYMINLDERPEKFARSEQELAPYGIYPYRFSAVNGWTLPEEVINTLGITYQRGMKKDLWGTAYLPGNEGKPQHEILCVKGRNYYSHCLSKGAIGIVLSHLSILKDALDSGYKTILVMEDDVQVVKNPKKLSELITRLDKRVGKDNWDVLFTDPDTKNANGEYIPCTGYAVHPKFNPQNPKRFAERKNISKDFTKVGARYGAYSMIIRRSGMKKIYNFIVNNGIWLPYDMEFYLPDDINLYSLRYDVISTLPNALSDNGAPRYNK